MPLHTETVFAKARPQWLPTSADGSPRFRFSKRGAAINPFFQIADEHFDRMPCDSWRFKIERQFSIATAWN
jgi:hypothetical protein